jgi:hypothetical protein
MTGSPYIEIMVFDLGRAFWKKEEFESARLMDFEFRQRSRATKNLVQILGLSDNIAAGIVATLTEEASLERLSALSGVPLDAVRVHYAECLVTARAQLIEERGDPTPQRLA